MAGKKNSPQWLRKVDQVIANGEQGDVFGNVGVLGAKLKIIDESNPEKPMWKTIGTCLDTPNALERELRKKKYKGESVWIFTTLGKRYHGLVK